MPKRIFFLFLLLPFYLSLFTPIHALYIPRIQEDARKEAYQQKLKTYSPQNQQKLEKLGKTIANLNKKESDQLTQIMEGQAQIMDEYERRQNLIEVKQTDGKTRNLSNQFENARYWLTYPHEAVAFEAAKNYIFTLSSEATIKRDATNTVSEFENDMVALQGK